MVSVTAPNFLDIVPTQLDIIKKYNLDELMTASEISVCVVNVLTCELLGGPVSELEVRRKVYELFRTIFQVQFESRGLIIDFELINEIASRFELQTENKSCTICLPDEWHQKVDKLLRTWACQKCGDIVRGVPHPPEDCNQYLIGHVIGS